MTRTREINDTEWTLITSNACSFQVLGNYSVYVKENATKPSIDDTSFKIALPDEIYTFDPSDGKLYARTKNGLNKIGYELV